MRRMTSPADSLVTRAREGDARALEELIVSVRDDIYNLAIRMLWHPEDAEDASQEILLKVVTHLGGFREESAFSTWVHRIAANHLLNVRKGRVEREALTFERFGEQLADGLDEVAAPAATEPDQALLEEEVKIGCTQGMLLCLDRDDRIAYVLGDVFGLRSEDAAKALGVEPAAFRKRLSRARERLRGFMRGRCGLVSEDAACRCGRRVRRAVETGRVDPQRLLFAGHRDAESRVALPVIEEVGEMEDLHGIAEIFRSHPKYASRERLVDAVRELIRSARHTLLR
jgi:RNA polymerase sigma factor (sigma-70 family)